MSLGFTRGDRIPDIERLNHAGEPQMLYDLQVGQPITLLLFDDSEAADTRTALAALGRDDPDWRKITRVALVQGTPAQCSRLFNRASTGLTVLTDDGAVASHLLGSAPAGLGRITAFALDANFRVIERIENGVGGNLADFLRRLMSVYQREAPRIPQVLNQQAPVLFIPRVLDTAFCGELIALFEKDGGQPSGVAHIEGDKALWQPNATVKMRRDVYIKNGAWLERIKGVLVKRVLPEIKRCFNYQVTQHEVFKLVCYDASTGGYFRPHRDNESRDTQHRRFAMTLNLNTGDYSGGQLRYPEFSPDYYEPERGGAVVFSSSLLHEVTPVTAGRRYVLLGFFFGDTETIQPVEYVPTS
ncbi:MAG TPA: 2OG-Fe(II) oxygenase [Gammaproteobacteria bacterium]|nr:2OG-Fe(II) oxygenase [Gammaproteobacteria bacterium]